MWTRREVLKVGAMGGASLALPWNPFVGSAAAAPPLDGGTLLPFIDPLPLPGVLGPVASVDGVAQYRVAMTQFRQQLHAQLPPTTLWGYAGAYPGPTIEARSEEHT